MIRILLLDLLDSSSDDDWDCEYDITVILAKSKKRKIWIEDHIKHRKHRSEFKLYNDLSEKKTAFSCTFIWLFARYLPVF